MKRIPVSIQKRYKKVMNQVVEDLSNTIIVYSPSDKVECPNCYYDSVTNKSSGVFDSSFVSSVTIFSGTSSEQVITPISFTNGRCPVCFGNGFLERELSTTIKALIDFFPSELRDQRGSDIGLSWYPYGRDGKSYVQLKTHKKYYNLLLNALFVEHAGVRYEFVQHPLFSGVGLDALVICWIIPVGTDSRVQNE